VWPAREVTRADIADGAAGRLWKGEMVMSLGGRAELGRHQEGKIIGVLLKNDGGQVGKLLRYSLLSMIWW